MSSRDLAAIVGAVTVAASGRGSGGGGRRRRRDPSSGGSEEACLRAHLAVSLSIPPDLAYPTRAATTLPM